MEINGDLEIDAFSYELVFVGVPVYFNLAPQPVMKFLQGLRSRAANLPAAPEEPGILPLYSAPTAAVIPGSGRLFHF
jgi:hypothetical protein